MYVHYCCTVVHVVGVQPCGCSKQHVVRESHPPRCCAGTAIGCVPAACLCVLFPPQTPLLILPIILTHVQGLCVRVISAMAGCICRASFACSAARWVGGCTPPLHCRSEVEVVHVWQSCFRSTGSFPMGAVHTASCSALHGQPLQLGYNYSTRGSCASLIVGVA